MTPFRQPIRQNCFCERGTLTRTGRLLRRRRRRRMSEALAEDWREEAVGTGGDEPLRRIDEPREPAIAVIVGGSYDAMVSQGLWRPIVRSRMGGPPKWPLPELTARTQSPFRSGVARVPFTRRLHEREREKQTDGQREWKLGFEIWE